MSDDEELFKVSKGRVERVRFTVDTTSGQQQQQPQSAQLPPRRLDPDVASTSSGDTSYLYKTPRQTPELADLSGEVLRLRAELDRAEHASEVAALRAETLATENEQLLLEVRQDLSGDVLWLQAELDHAERSADVAKARAKTLATENERLLLQVRQFLEPPPTPSGGVSVGVSVTAEQLDQTDANDNDPDLIVSDVVGTVDLALASPIQPVAVGINLNKEDKNISEG